MNKEYKELEEQGEQQRKIISMFLESYKLKSDQIKDLWIKINELINIEIELEEYCNK